MIAIFPEIAAQVLRGEIETTAVLVRRYFGGKQVHSPKLNMHLLYQQAAIPVSIANIEPLSALIVSDHGGRIELRILIRRDIAGTSQENFLLAHLFGHLILHIQPKIAKGDWQQSGVKENTSPLTRYIKGSLIKPPPLSEAQREHEADQFAAALLLPMGMILRAYSKLSNIDAVGSFFAVPPALIECRLKALEDSSAQPMNFLDAEARLSQEVERSGAKTAQLSSLQHQEPMKAAEGFAKIKQVLSQSSYAREAGDRVEPPKTPNTGLKPQGQSNEPLNDTIMTTKGLEKIRALARRIDPKV